MGKHSWNQRNMTICWLTTKHSHDLGNIFGLWAVFRNLISALGIPSIHQWRTSRAIWENVLPSYDPAGWPEALQQMKQIETLVEKLVAYRERCKRHHERISALRDGLFNASAVMESRASTKLGSESSILPRNLTASYLTKGRKCQTLDFCLHLFPSPGLLHIPLEHQQRPLSSHYPYLRHHDCRICHISRGLQSQLDCSL